MTTALSRPPRGETLEDLELDLLLEGIRRRYGHDLRGYDRGFLRRRIRARQREEKLRSTSQLLERVLRRRSSFSAFLDCGEESDSPLFRPARVWRAIRERALPPLRTYPSVRTWLAGSTSGSDLPSLLILLAEELPRPHLVYATGLGESLFGSFRSSALDSLSRHYRDSGGRRSLSDHFRINDDRMLLRPELRQRAVFATHNMGTDASFNAFHLIVARSTLSQEAPPLRDRRFALLHESLLRFGFLLLGRDDSPERTPRAKAYRTILRSAGLYQKVSE